MTDDELLALIEAREGESYGYGDGELSEKRAEAIARFLGEPYGDEREGRSQVVATDLRDTVLWAMPQLLRVFLGGDELVRFDARGPEDEKQAKLETEYINWLALERNDAFQHFCVIVQDALLLGTGYAKVWWDSSEDIQTEEYRGKSDDELGLLLGDADVEVVEHTAYPDPNGGGLYMDPMAGPVEIPAPMLHDVKVRRRYAEEMAKYAAVPPEELLVHKTVRTVSLQRATFVEHRRMVTISELREMGYDIADDEFGPDEWMDSAEEDARNRFEDEFGESVDPDPSMRRVLYRECYLRADIDRDGIAELRKVCVANKKVLDNDAADCVPFAAFSPILFGHRHHGLSFYDLLAEITAIKTALIRGMLDSQYLAVQPRTAVDVNRVNLDDMLVSRPGGVVRVQGDPASATMPLVTPDVGKTALSGIQYVDAWKQDASGINPYFQGGAMLDSQALNKTASGVSQLITQAQSRIEAVARSLSDGVRDLFLLLHQITLKNATKAEKVRLSNEWVPIDPREWVRRSNLSVQVALGAGSKEMQTQQLQQLMAMQMQLLPVGMVKPENLYNTASRLTQAMGFRSPEEFWTDPSKQPPQPPPPNPQIEAEKIKAQAQMQIKGAEMQAQAADDQRQFQIEQQRLQAEMQAEQFKAQLQAEIQRYKAELDAQLEREKSEMQRQTQLQIARMNAYTQRQSNMGGAKVKRGH
jgi:hypothetical protein